MGPDGRRWAQARNAGLDHWPRPSARCSEVSRGENGSGGWAAGKAREWAGDPMKRRERNRGDRVGGRKRREWDDGFGSGEMGRPNWGK